MLKSSTGKRKGKAGEKAVRIFLKKYAKAHSCCQTDGIYLPLYNGCCEIDHLLFGEFGVAVIETKSIGGQLLGHPSDKYLLHKIGGRQHTLYNPLQQNRTHCDNVRHHLNKGGFNTVPIYPFTVFTDENIVLEHPSLGTRLSGLEERLKRLPDAGCDGKMLYRYILSQKVRNPFKKGLHVLKIKLKKRSK